MPFNKQQLTAFALGIILAGTLAGMFWSALTAQKARTEIALELMRSERDLSTVQTLKAMKALREAKNEEAIRFLEVWMRGQLGLGASNETMQRAKEYQHAFCKEACLGVE